MNVVEMTTNDEIREQENMQMAHYESLTTAEQADRERSLMNKARAEERTRIIRALGNELTKTYAEQRYIDGIRDVIAFIKEMK